MLLDKMDQERVQSENRRPAGNTRASWVWAKDWAFLGIAAITLFALVGIAVAAMIFANSVIRVPTG
jgi:hypothetical protein